MERQCGVLLPNGLPCARSLTCKSHSMGAKRAVAGRSLPYDMLLAAYQKKNQAKQQSAFLLNRLSLSQTLTPSQKQRWMPMRQWKTKTRPTQDQLTQTRRLVPSWLPFQVGNPGHLFPSPSLRLSVDNIKWRDYKNNYPWPPTGVAQTFLQWWDTARRNYQMATLVY